MDQMERRQILLARQHLTAPADRLTVCGDLNGLQAQFLSCARHALATRCSQPLDGSWGEGLVKSWTIRGTMHIFREDDLPLFLHQGRDHFLRDVDRFADDPWATAERKQLFAGHILRRIGQGSATREELRSACREAGLTAEEERSVFDSWGGLLRAMSEAGMICYQVRPGKSFRRCPPFVPLAAEEARLEQARRYFTHFGPASVRDAAYYFGAPQKQVKSWLDQLPVRAEVCQGRDCFSIDDGLRDFPDVPDCILLAGFDQLMLGYDKRESVFLPREHLRGVFNLSGIVLPCVLLKGEAAARWKLSGRTCAVTPFRTLRAREKRAVEGQIRRWFPEVRQVGWEE